MDNAVLRDLIRFVLQNLPTFKKVIWAVREVQEVLIAIGNPYAWRPPDTNLLMGLSGLRYSISPYRDNLVQDGQLLLGIDALCSTDKEKWQAQVWMLTNYAKPQSRTATVHLTKRNGSPSIHLGTEGWIDGIGQILLRGKAERICSLPLDERGTYVGAKEIKVAVSRREGLGLWTYNRVTKVAKEPLLLKKNKYKSELHYCSFSLKGRYIVSPEEVGLIYLRRSPRSFLQNRYWACGGSANEDLPKPEISSVRYVVDTLRPSFRTIRMPDECGGTTPVWITDDAWCEVSKKDGNYTLYIVRLPELRLERTIPLPASPQRGLQPVSYDERKKELYLESTSWVEEEPDYLIVVSLDSPKPTFRTQWLKPPAQVGKARLGKMHSELGVLWEQDRPADIERSMSGEFDNYKNFATYTAWHSPLAGKSAYRVVEMKYIDPMMMPRPTIVSADFDTNGDVLLFYEGAIWRVIKQGR